MVSAGYRLARSSPKGGTALYHFSDQLGVGLDKASVGYIAPWASFVIGWAWVVLYQETFARLNVKAHARGSGGSTCCGEWAPALLSGLADQHVVGNRSGAGADAEESIERRMPCAAPVEAEYELVQVVLKICPSQAVVNTQAPALEI